VILQRRELLVGIGSLLAAPAIVHAGNLMPVKIIPPQVYRVPWGAAIQGSDDNGLTWTDIVPISTPPEGEFFDIFGDVSRALQEPRDWFRKRRLAVVPATRDEMERQAMLTVQIRMVQLDRDLPERRFRGLPIVMVS
jgi:hypothetical protein